MNVTEAKDDATKLWDRIKQKNPWLVHVLRANQRFGENHGNHYAAAITFFSFLALFPLILLSVSVLGFVLHSHPALQQDLLDKITEKAPGGFGDTLKDSIKSAIDSRGSVGVVGLLGLVLTGSGWISNLRAAIEGVWGQLPAKRSFLVKKLADLAVLVGLGLGILISLGLTAVGTALSSRIIDAVGLGDVPGMGTLLAVLGILLGIGGDMLIFGWVLIRLPRADVPPVTRIRGIILAAVGFEILKIVGTYTIKASSTNPTLGPFAGILAVLIWIQLVSRFMLFCVAWMASAQQLAAEASSIAYVSLKKEDDPVLAARADAPRMLSPVGVAGTFFGVGAAAGAWAFRRRRASAPSGEIE